MVGYWLFIARNGWKCLEMAGTAENGLKWQETPGFVRRYLKVAGNGWKLLKVAGNGQRWPEIAGND